MDGEGRERCEMQTGEVALIAVICFGVITGDLQTTYRQPAAPYQHHMTCPEFSDTLDITKGTRHEQASISIFVSASVCQHQTVARVIVLLTERTYAAGYAIHSFPMPTASIPPRSQLTYPPAARNALSDRY